MWLVKAVWWPMVAWLSHKTEYSCSDFVMWNTVKRVHKDHPAILIHRWSLYAGSITWKVYPWGPVKCGLYKQVVFIYRWSLELEWLYFLLRQNQNKNLHHVRLTGRTNTVKRRNIHETSAQKYISPRSRSGSPLSEKQTMKLLVNCF